MDFSINEKKIVAINVKPYGNVIHLGILFTETNKIRTLCPSDTGNGENINLNVYAESGSVEITCGRCQRSKFLDEKNFVDLDLINKKLFTKNNIVNENIKPTSQIPKTPIPKTA